MSELPRALRRALEAPALAARLGFHQITERVPLLQGVATLNGATPKPLVALASLLEPRPGQRQADQFRVQKALARLSLARVDDPLFACEVAPVGSTTVQALIVYRGLRIKGFARRPRVVELLVDGRRVRRDRIDADGKGRTFWLYVNRPALARFSPSSELVIRTSDAAGGHVVGEDRFRLKVPHGTGDLFRILDRCGPIDKKGNVPRSPEEAARMQASLLDLYVRVREVFEGVAGRPLFLMYGTLLGLYRDGDFIPGDDDFDVGYVSEASDPTSVKREAEGIIAALVRAGLTVTLNRKGKPFRVGDGTGGPDLHLDACPIWSQDGRVWANPFGCLPLGLDGFRTVTPRTLRGVEVAIPAGAEAFLEAYYGPAWRTPDPDYALSRPLAPEAARRLLAVCLKPAEVARLQDRIAAEGEGGGRLHSKALLDLYPLARYEAVCGWD